MTMQAYGREEKASIKSNAEIELNACELVAEEMGDVKDGIGRVP